MHSLTATALYRHFDKHKELLYVGVSLNALNRLGQHKRNAHWFNSISNVTIEHFPTRGEALAAETLAIQQENPLHNIKNKRHPLGIFLEKTQYERLEAAKDQITYEVTTLKAMYTSEELASELNIQHKHVRECIDKNLISAIKTKGGISAKGIDTRRWLISGWAYLDFIEFLEKVAVAPWDCDYEIVLEDFEF